jgi:RNA polymerase sigma factor (sigma-70 family)
MPVPPARLLQQLRGLSGRDGLAPADAVLLARFARGRDEGAFAALVGRHGPMVLRLCRRVLADPHAADDAFQATFLVLARRAGALLRPQALAGWLYGVAYRVARRARAVAARRREVPVADLVVPDRRPDPLAELSARDLLAVVDEEVRWLPQAYRLPVLLCCVEGLSQEEAARRLGWTPGSVKGRLERGRARLHTRLVRRGLALPAALAAVEVARGAAAEVPAGLAAATVRAAPAFAAGRGVAGTGVPPRAALLAQAGLAALTPARALLMAALLLLGPGLALTGAGLFARRAAVAPEPPAPAAPAAEARARADRYGDPLPEGALFRLGTSRFLHAGAVRAIAFADNDRVIVSAGDDHLIRLWDAATGKELRQLPGHQGLIYALAVSPDGKYLASAGSDRAIRLWGLASGKELRRLEGHRDEVNAVAFSPDGRLLASGGNDKTLRLWDVEAGRELRQCAEIPGRVCSVEFFPDGRRLAAGSYDGGTGLWEVASGKRLGGIGAAPRALCVAVSPDGARLATAHETRACLWEVAGGRLLHEITSQSRDLDRVAFSPDGKVLAAAGLGGSIRLLDPATGRERQPLSASVSSGTVALAFSHDGKRLASGGFGGRVYLWDVAGGRQVYPFEGHAYPITAVAFAPDGKALATGSYDRTVRLWGLSTGRERHRLAGYRGWGPASVVFAPGGLAVVAQAAEDNGIRRWDTTTGRELPARLGQNRTAQVLGVARDGRLLAALSHQRKVRVWEVATGKEVLAVPGPGELDHLALSPDGRFLGCRSFSKGGPPDRVEVLSAWDLATGKELRPLTGRRVPLGSPFAFSPDGDTLAAEGENRWVYLWDVRSGARRGRLAVRMEERDWLSALVYSPDGRLVASGHATGSVRLWEVATGEEVRCWRGHRARVFGLAFAPDGRTLASGSEDATALVWDVAGRPAPLARGELESLWSDLGGDAGRAQRTIWRLVAAGDTAVPLLGRRLRGLEDEWRARGRRVEALLAALDRDEFAERERATAELRRLGRLAEPALRRALAGRPSAEARRRIQGLLDGLEDGAWPPDVIQGGRALAALEHIGTLEARKTLKELAQGPADARLTREAKAALERLARRAGR